MNQLDRAAVRARKLYRSKGFQGVYMRGVRAALAGRPSTANPYPTDDKKTWRASYRRAWHRGHRSISKTRVE